MLIVQSTLPFEIGSTFNLIQSTIALPAANIDDLKQMGFNYIWWSNSDVQFLFLTKNFSVSDKNVLIFFLMGNRKKKKAMVQFQGQDVL